ncbi:MFS transporter [Streptomyces sp. NPDC019937]|uniref:MFS transporter n=1 Tax=Streptomyces sp. NPDC019937 TaxID=3154787 RepID=UPI00340F86B7
MPVPPAAPARVRVVAPLALSLLLGVVTAALGAALPLLRSAYGLPEGGGAELVGLYNLGALAGVAACGLGGRTGAGRSSTGRPVLALLAAFAGGCAGMALAPTWWLLNAFATATGFGFGGLLLYLNAFFGRFPGRRGLLLMNLLHACFGAGATVGPLLVGRFGEVSWLLLVTAGLTAPLLRPARHLGTAGPGAPPTPGTDTATGAPAGRRSLPLLIVFAAVAFLYAGVEAGTGALESTHLEAAGRSAEGAAGLTALFWAGLTAGRVVLPPVTHRLRPPRLVLLCLLAATGLLLTTLDGRWAPAGYGLAGFALGTVFPTVLVWATAVLPLPPERVSAVLLLTNLIGSAALPPLLGLFAAPARAAVSIPLSIATLTLLCGLAVTAAVALAPRADPTAARRHPADRPDQKVKT